MSGSRLLERRKTIEGLVGEERTWRVVSVSEEV